MKSKKGVELSMNFMVIVILSIVMFGFGMKFLYDIVNAAEKVPDFSPVEQMLNSKMAAGEKVVVYPSSASLKSGQREIFGVGVLNIGAPSNFEVIIDADTLGNKLTRPSARTFLLDNNKDRKLSFIVDSKGATKQTHEITVRVLKDGQSYDVKKAYVTIS